MKPVEEAHAAARTQAAQSVLWKDQAQDLISQVELQSTETRQVLTEIHNKEVERVEKDSEELLGLQQQVKQDALDTKAHAERAETACLETERNVADIGRQRTEVQRMLDAKPDVNATDGLEGVCIRTRRPGQGFPEEPSGKDNTSTEKIEEAVEAACAIQRFYNDMAEKADNNVGLAAMPQPAVRSVFPPNDTTPHFVSIPAK